MSDLVQDLRYAGRTLLRAPAFATIAIITLSLGIGANTAIFSLVNAALLRPLPYPEGDRIVRVHQTTPDGYSTVSPPDFVDWRSGSSMFAGMAAFHRNSYTLTGAGDAKQVRAAQVTGDFFRVMALAPLVGRFIDSADALPDGEPVVVLSEALWRRDFGADPAIAGRRIMLDGAPTTVLGVAPGPLDYPHGTEIWTPRTFDEEDLTTQRGAHYLGVIARLAPGAAMRQATGQIAAVGDRLATEYPTTNARTSATLLPLRESIVGDAKPALYLLVGAVALVLLIACANVANLFVARALSRRRDLALRQAVGASRGRLARLVLVESVLLAGAGGGLGLLLAAWGTPLLARLRPDDTILQSAAIDGRVLIATLVVSMISGLLFGVFPALRLVPARGISQQLMGGGRGSFVTREAHRARRFLVVSEMTLAFVLLVGAGLLLRSFIALQGTALGFETASRLTFSLQTPDATYDTADRVDAFYTQVMERLRTLPGVEVAGATQGLPLSGNSYGISTHSIDGRELSNDESSRLGTQLRVVRPGYFSAMGIPVLRGRAIAERDRSGAANAIMLNETAARLLFPGTDPLGHEVLTHTSFGLRRGRAGGTVVGIVGDTRDRGADEESSPMIYLSHAQFPLSSMQVVLRANGEPEALARAARAAVAAIDPNVPVFELQTMEARFSVSVAQPRFLLTLLGIFACTAVVLASIGLYGVIAQGVIERTREIGIRLALGARPREVQRMIVRAGGGLAVAGIAIGLAGAFAGSRAIAAYLFGVQPIDPLTMAGAVFVLLPVALLASWIPARRATRVDPAITLRAE
ncbi:MAG TPA: ABC transporter permease [Gemmatimonadaceae bacterium]|nr:ABC transporter permease [Gemmatimonadaceae bacterium]